MKNKKGFTLVELLGVITILGILALIAMPTIDAITTKNREKVYNTQIETIKNGLKTWGDGNALSLPENSGEYLMINLGILKKAGFVDEDIKDPTTDACFSNDAVLTITKVGSGYSYHVDEESLKGGTSDDCEAPLDDYFLLLKGESNIEIDFYESYVEPGYTVVDSTGKIINVSVNITIKNKDGNVVSSIDNTSDVHDIYTITYEYNGITVERKVVYGIIVEYVFDYKGSVQEIYLPAGKWKLEVWGAQGGYRTDETYGGKGGYSVGILNLTHQSPLYVYVGSSGNEGGFNGGGKRQTYSGGGGATDIRIGQDSLYARVIVAGGGGSDGAKNKSGKYGGGLTGGVAGESFGILGYGGAIAGNTYSTTSYLSSSQSSSLTTEAGAYSGFGFGGNGIYRSSGYGGAGGGGWYGGTGAYPDGSGDDDRGGGGGSGWVYTAENFNTWKNGRASDAAGWLLDESYYLTNASTIAGDQSFLDPDGTEVTGHSGNGYAKITKVG